MSPQASPGDGSWPVQRWFTDIPDVEQRLAGCDYLADRGLATAVFLATSLNLPLLLEGEVGVGKTEVAKAVAHALDRRVVRLQCYEGIDSTQALYEWDYPRQLLYLRAVGDVHPDKEKVVEDLYGPRFLNERPLLEAIRAGSGVVLLIDEIDRADDEFEAFLLEVLADFQVSIPEIGTVKAVTPPFVVLTSNRTRELHDALKRRCLYHWIDYPDPDREMAIVRARVPEVPEDLARRIVEAVHRFRRLDLIKRPGVAETINWALTLDLLEVDELDAGLVRPTLGALLKEREDLDRVAPLLDEVLA
ncbi:MAG: MoxR family ATPase [bacterium]|nr:MoxR family ATPase [bacterium]